MGSRGYYSLAVLDKEENRVEEKCTGTIGNVITYDGAYYSLITDDMFGDLYGAVGTGTTERTRNSTGLDTPVSGRTSRKSVSRSGKEVDNLNGTSTLTLTRTLPFSLGDKVGTFSEVGLYTSSSTGTFIAGQLIKDELGNPTTITVLADEQLVITYTLEWTVPISSNLVGTGSVTDAASNTYNYEVWAQPYFRDYAVGSTSTTNIFSSSYNVLSTITSDTSVSRKTFSDSNAYSYSQSPGGVVSYSTSQNKVLGPTSGTFTDAVYVALGTSGSYGDASFKIVDESSPLRSSFSYSAAPAIIKFLQPISKSSNESFNLAISLEYQI